MKSCWWLLVGCWLLNACGEGPKRETVPAFYHWQTNLTLTPGERLYLDSASIKKLYVKFFDVDWDEAAGQPVPLASLECDSNCLSLLSGLEIIPTVFITNRTLLNLPMPEVDSLSVRIFDKIVRLAPASFQEIQFDCDWTEQTRDKFFRLIESFRRIAAGSPQSTVVSPQSSVHSPQSSVTNHQSPITLSATIRLHQLKYFEKTGIPPVDRGMMMFYNMGDLESWETENSILDLGVAEDYLPQPNSPIHQFTNSPYPLPLDIALPLFRWGVLFRDGRLVKLINGLNEEDLSDTLRFSKITATRFEVRKNTYLQGYYLYEGDRIRLESVSAGQLEETAGLLTRRFPKSSPELTVAFYHLDTSLLKTFPPVFLERILEKF